MQTQIEMPRRSPKIYSWRDMPVRRRAPAEVVRAAAIGAQCGAVAGSKKSSSSPLIVMSGHVVAGYIPETGLTSVSWADQGPNSYNLSGTCTVQTNQINGYSCAKGNGTTNVLSRSQALSPPGTSPIFQYVVVRIDTYLNNLPITSLGVFNELAILMHTATDQVSQFSGGSYGNANASGCTVGSFKLIKTKFSNSTADSIKAGGGALVTGTNTGNTTPTGIYLFQSNGSTSALSFAEYWIFNQDPGTSLDSYFDSKFPGCRT
jgi:hypothetical protein